MRDAYDAWLDTRVDPDNETHHNALLDADDDARDADREDNL